MKLNNIRPNTLNEFIGQETVKFNLNLHIQAIKKNMKTLDHILISGPSGTGKTTLASIISNELNYKITYVQGAHINKFSDILNLFSLIVENQIIFIDEFHKIEKNIIELMYTIMEDFVIDVPIGTNNNAQVSRLKIPHFTLIGATNFVWKLPTSLIDRFPVKIFLNNYNEKEITKIIEQICINNEINYKYNDLIYIAKIARYNPRNAINFLKNYLDYKICYSNNKDSVNHIFQKLGIYKYGLMEQDIQYLLLLEQKNNISLMSIAQNLMLDKNTIEMNIEKYLIKLNFIKISSKGRSITENGSNYLKELNLK